jgi:molecular chaperone GrpE
MTKSDKKEVEKILSEDKKETQKNTVAEKESAPPKEETIEDKLKVTQEKLLRTMAEMENQRRRFEKENQEAYEFGGFNLARESLSLLDNIDRAIISFKNDENLRNNKNLNKIIDSIEIIKQDLVSIFKKNGITPIECMNKKFDPNFHQAMLELEDNTKDAGTVIQEIQKGFMMKDRLLRPTLVGVTKKREEKVENIKNDEKKEEKK